MTRGSASVSGRDAGTRPTQDRLRALTGLAFPENRLGALRAGLDRAMARAGIRDQETYLARLAHEPALLDELVAEITVGETYFFRNAPQCQLIRDRILPELIGGRGRAPLRLWSAGCATGEEAYTLGILHAEAGAREPARILGTDLSRGALACARRGRYGRWALRGMPPEQVARYFQASGVDFVLRPGIATEVEFRYLNLAEDSYPSLVSGISAMDLVLCRNVLIYFDGSAARDVIRRLMSSLAPGGWLLLGASDPHPADPGPCEVVVTESGLAYRRRTGEGRSSRRGARVAAAAVPLPAPPASLGARAGLGPEPPAPLPHPAPSGRRRAGASAPAPGPTDPERDPDPDPGHDIWVARVRSLANAGDLRAAGEACATGLDRNRASAELTYLHGVLLAEAGRPAEAAAALRACLYLDRALAVAHLALGGTLARLGDAAGARRALANAERLLASQNPDDEVPASDGEHAGRLLAATRAHLGLLSTGAT